VAAQSSRRGEGGWGATEKQQDTGELDAAVDDEGGRLGVQIPQRRRDVDRPLDALPVGVHALRRPAPDPLAADGQGWQRQRHMQRRESRKRKRAQVVSRKDARSSGGGGGGTGGRSLKVGGDCGHPAGGARGGGGGGGATTAGLHLLRQRHTRAHLRDGTERSLVT